MKQRGLTVSSNDLALFERFPKTRTLPHVKLGEYPTPLRQLEVLGPKMGIKELWVKQDDQSGPLYGGNKVRKLEFLLGEALEQGKQSVLTIGAIGSHHVLATSIYARSVGLEPAAQHWPQPLTPHVLDNLRALSTTKPQLVLMPSIAQLPFHLFKKRVQAWISKEPGMHYIAGGGSSPLGVIGYVNAAFELAAQIDSGEMAMPDAIFVAAGTTGTLAGIALGVKMLGLPIRVYGVRVVEKVVTNVTNTRRLAHGAVGLLKERGVEVEDLSSGDVTMIDDYYGQGYGVATKEGLEIAKRAWEEESLKLEPTYTAKAFSAIEETAKAKGHQRVLYWHTLNGVDLSDRIQESEPFVDLPKGYHKFFDPRAMP